jgi:hypothetical protein
MLEFKCLVQFLCSIGISKTKKIVTVAYLEWTATVYIHLCIENIDDDWKVSLLKSDALSIHEFTDVLPSL